MNTVLFALLALNPLFSDHAVLQRDRELTVWGTGAVPDEVLTLTFARSTTWTRANRDGTFRFILQPQEAGGPHVLKVSGEKSGTAEAQDVLVGEVWLCSGQSNMELLMKSADPGWGDRTDPQLRCYRAPHQYGFGPCAESRSEWRQATPANVQQFTAVGTFFGAALRRELGVPVGLLCSALGGTTIEAWSPRESLETTDAGRRVLRRFSAAMSDPGSWKRQDKDIEKIWPRDPGPSAEALSWATPEDASSGWRQVPVPSTFWELANRSFNGAVWYRRDFVLPDEWKGRDLVLTIPAADKHDRTYANGRLIGATGTGFDTSFHNKKRVYRVPADLLSTGRVRIAIRVWSHVYGGGIGGFGEDFRLAPEGERGMALDGTWQVRIERDVGVTGSLPTPFVAGNANIPHALFDSEILPLVPYGIRGAIWYQGESNEGNADDYHDLLRAMVEGWRSRWGQGDFPFVAVQLAAYRDERPFAEADAWSEIRQAVLDVSRELPKVGVASALDVGNARDIHPTDKKTVGERLAAWALHHTYGRDKVVATGPRPQVCWTEGDALVVRFTDTGDGLKSTGPDGRVRGVYVSDRSGKFLAAPAVVDGADFLKVDVRDREDVQEVRYAWAQNPGPVDLRNSAGLPASPFRMCVCKKVAEDAAKPDKGSGRAILPGWGKYYWNVHSKWYIHPPVFDFKAVAGAVKYRNRILADDRPVAVFLSETPKTDLTAVWAQLPKKGLVQLECDGLNARGECLSVSGRVTFWKNAPFEAGAYEPAVRSYGEAAERTYAYVFRLPAVEKLAGSGKPDPAYALNCYPTKMNAAIVNAAVRRAETEPARKAEMLRLARAAADYLIATAEPAGSPLAFFTQTYSKEHQELTARKYQGQHMLDYPCRAATAFVRLSRLSEEGRYLAAAERIAETYLKLQGEDGTWPLKMWATNGTAAASNRLFPLGVCEMMETLYAETQKPEYRAAADRAFAFVEQGPLANWNWEGQFEDVAPSTLYNNLTKHPAVDTAMYLLRRYPGDAARLAQARALMEFAEDQFVAWERPCRADGVSYPRYGGSCAVKGWTVFPTVMEQYEWYVPTDASVAKMIRGYLAIYAAEKDPTDLAKARALGDAFTRAQQASGRIPTQWMGGEFKDARSDWINCTIASADALALLAQVCSKDDALNRKEDEK